MLDKIRKFSKTIFAKILLVVMVIPFIFWGMGGVFNSGNTNSIAKVNNNNISTQDFIEFLNNSKIDQNVIAANIENNILEELLRQFISIKILDLEIKDFNIQISDNELARIIKNDKNFLDDKNIFSRVKYEKFLLTSNITAAVYEKAVKERVLQKKLFSYIGSGVKSPNFLTNKKYIEDTKQIDIEYINLENIYKPKHTYSDSEVANFIKDNKSDLEKDFINFSYGKIIPSDLVDTNEFSNKFFETIDEIENKISNDVDFTEIAKLYELKIIEKNDFLPNKNSSEIEKKIYNLRNKSTSMLTDENDYFLFFKINEIKKKVPNISDIDFVNDIKERLFLNDKYQYNKKLLNEINNKTFNKSNFKSLVDNDDGKINKMTLKSINDGEKFSLDSVNLIYSMPIGSFNLISDDQNNVYISQIVNEKISNIAKKGKILNIYNEKSASDIKRDILVTYDQILNSKYKIKINEKTLDRVKSYF